MIGQIFAIAIFIIMFLMIILEKFERHTITLVSGVAVLVIVFGFCMQSMNAVVETLNVHSIFTTGFWYGESGETTSGINWATIIFIAGMMIMVEAMGKTGFFKWLCLSIAKAVNYKTVPLLICFMIISGVLAMFIDSITVVLFLAAVTVELARTLKFNPVPMILSEIFCANLGGAATMCGDPPNIIIGTALGYSFFDFISNTGVIVAICFVFTVIYFWICFRKELKKSEKTRPSDIIYPQPSEAVENKAAFISSIVIFALAVVLLVTHAQTTLSVAFIGVFIAIISIISIYMTMGKSALKHIIEHFDYKTILFFIGLFISVGGLEQTGVLAVLADFIGKISGGNVVVIIVIILWLSAVASAFIDNIPFAATMVPVIQSMAATQGIGLDVLAWTLSLGTDLGGNGTPIGASANVVGTSVSAKSGHPIGWGKYCKYCVPATAMVLIISMICLFAKYVF